MSKKNLTTVPQEETVLNPTLVTSAPEEIKKDETAAPEPAKEVPVVALIEERPPQFDTRIHEGFTPEGEPRVAHRTLVDAVWYKEPKQAEIVQFVFDPTNTASGDSRGYKGFRVMKVTVVGHAFRTFKTSPPRLMVLCASKNAHTPEALDFKLYPNHQGIAAFELSGTCRRSLLDGSILKEDKAVAAKFLGTYKEPVPVEKKAPAVAAA